MDMLHLWNHNTARIRRILSSMEKKPSTVPTRWQSPTGWNRKETSPTNCRKLPILCTGSGSYYINGTVWDIITTKCPDRKPMKRVNQFLDYMWTHPDAIIRYHASDMILNVHSDASYCTSLHPKHAAVRVYRATETQSNLMGPFMSRAPYSNWLLHLQQKPNWEHSSWMHKKQKYFDLSLPNLVIHNHLHQFTSTTQPQSVS